MGCRPGIASPEGEDDVTEDIHVPVRAFQKELRIVKQYAFRQTTIQTIAVRIKHTIGTLHNPDRCILKLSTMVYASIGFLLYYSAVAALSILESKNITDRVGAVSLYSKWRDVNRNIQSCHCGTTVLGTA